MKSMLLLSIITITVISSCANSTPKTPSVKPPMLSDEECKSQVNKYLSARPNYLYDPKGWQAYLDSAIVIDPENSYLWQQKAMPYFKARKYSVGMQHLTRAVALDRDAYLDYQAFIKCIFSKEYESALKDLEELISKNDKGIVQDHTYHFYAALCQLQLEQFPQAKASLERSIENQLTNGGEEWVHFMDHFYLGIAQYELGEFDEAIESFNETIKTYSKMADAHFYKSYAYFKTQNVDSAKASMRLAKSFIKDGHTINESNAVYETYPYQISKGWFR